MAETAKILNPSKTVLLPDLEAGCSLSDSCPAERLAEYKEQNPHLYVVAYVNCSAASRKLSDVICTSGNAVGIVEKVPETAILFVPDQNLGRWVIGQTDRQMRLSLVVVMPMSSLPKNPLNDADLNIPGSSGRPLNVDSV